MRIVIVHLKRLFLLTLILFFIIMTSFSDVPHIENIIQQKPNTSIIKYSNAAIGFEINVPQALQTDRSYEPLYTRFFNEDFSLRISKESSPYDDLDYYFNRYIYKYILNPEFQQANKIKVLENCYKRYSGFKTKIVAYSRETPDKNAKNYYYQAFVITNKRDFYTFQFKMIDPTNYFAVMNRILNSFKVVTPTDKPDYAQQSPKLVLEPTVSLLNSETIAYYNTLNESKKVQWGIFYPSSLDAFKKYEEIEKKINYRFPVILHYIWLGHPLPKEVLHKAYERGKVVELTLQTMWSIIPDDLSANKNTLHSTIFDVIDGKYDAYLRNFARELKEFQHPVLFRLNNEMNGTWTVYSGIAAMCDPDVFVEAWRHIYDIFKQEKVDNALWIFNPNGIDYPPLNWNNQLCYYPGNEYVQIIGLTGYNTGTYFNKETGETWRSFNEIYQPIAEKYNILYSKFPWMITEFASNSVGGDKKLWIRNMFRSIEQYPQIKIAVWWSYYDPDPATKEPARKYWLDEKEEYLVEFKNGLIRSGIKNN